MKAYKCSCNDDYHGMRIIFANSSPEAKIMYPMDRCDCEFIERMVHREPKFDDLSPGPITIEQYISRGWYFACHVCDQNVYEDCSGKILVGDSHVFCSRECMLREAESLREIGDNWHESLVQWRRELLDFIDKTEKQ